MHHTLTAPKPSAPDLRESYAGSPWLVYEAKVTCPTCSGLGEYEEFRYANSPGGSWNTPYHAVECIDCRDGIVSVNRCGRCGGLDEDTPRLETGETFGKYLMCDCAEDDLEAWINAGCPVDASAAVDRACRYAMRTRTRLIFATGTYRQGSPTLYEVQQDLQQAARDARVTATAPLDALLADELDRVAASMGGAL